MSIGHRRFPEVEPDRTRIAAIVNELHNNELLLDLTRHEGWDLLNAELTRRELSAMQQLASGSTEVSEITFNRAVAQICKYLREMPERLEQTRETLQSELDSVVPQGGTGNGRR